jgi:membrane protease YdiL (CAAX protease family)
MNDSIVKILKQITMFRWKPSKDLAVVAASWLLVVGALYTATIIVGQDVWGGMAYFVLYAVVGATLFGVGIPLYWTIVVCRRSLADLGLTTRHWALSIVLQLVFALLQYIGTLAKTQLPSLEQLLPLLALALAIGFFEAVFWRGWVLLRLEEAFGIIPGILLGSLLYAAYHIGYGMPTNEMVFLFFIGIMFAVAFRLTKNILILWPIFQPMGQLVTLLRDQLMLPPLAALGFVEALIVMLVLVWLANRYYRKHRGQEADA